MLNCKEKLSSKQPTYGLALCYHEREYKVSILLLLYTFHMLLNRMDQLLMVTQVWHSAFHEFSHLFDLAHVDTWLISPVETVQLSQVLLNFFFFLLTLATLVQQGNKQ